MATENKKTKKRGRPPTPKTPHEKRIAARIAKLKTRIDALTSRPSLAIRLADIRRRAIREVVSATLTILVFVALVVWVLAIFGA